MKFYASTSSLRPETTANQHLRNVDTTKFREKCLENSAK